MAQAKQVKPLWAYCLAILDLVQPGMTENKNTASSHAIYAPTETVIPMIILTSPPDPVFYTTALPPHSTFRAETRGIDNRFAGQ